VVPNHPDSKRAEKEKESAAVNEKRKKPLKLFLLMFLGGPIGRQKEAF